MSDTDLRPLTDADIETPDADAPLSVADRLTNEGGGTTGTTAQAKQAIIDGSGKLASQATDKARFFADQGKAKAGETLDQVAQMLTDAAATVDDKLGAQYGQYARSAADRVSAFSASLKAKDADELVEDVRGFVRASPAVAVGVAAAVGFALARVVQSGIDSGPAKA